MKKLQSRIQTHRPAGALKLSQGFTLIELLVVIAIISLLAAILFPVFGRARENARRTTCMSNLKQQSMAIMQYSEDYDGTLPYGSIGDTTYAGMPGGIWSNNTWFWPQLGFTYHKTVQIFRCPNAEQTTAPHNGNYGANRVAMPLSIDGDPMKVSRLQSPASLFLIFDAGTYTIRPSDAASPTGKNYYVPGYGDAANNSAACEGLSNSSTTALTGYHKRDCSNGRHFGGSNVGYADGHVKWLLADVMYREAKAYNASTHPASAWDPFSK